jgi:hypothetical protein
MRDEAKEMNAPTELEPVREAFETRTLGTVTDQHNGDAGHSRRRSHEDINVLLWMESSDKDDAWSRDRGQRIVSGSSGILEPARHHTGRHNMNRRSDPVRPNEGSHPRH